MAPDERRAQLLRVGAEAFGARAFEDVWIEEVAQRAGVSRALLYHYFPSKREFFAAVVRHHADALLRATEPDPGLDPAHRLRASLEAYVRHVEANPDGYRALYRGATGADPTVRELMERNMERQARRILEDLPPALVHAETELAVRGWLGFLVASCLAWLDAPQIAAAALVDLWGRALGGALVTPSADHAVPDG